MTSSIEDQAISNYQPIDLTVSNMTSFLDWFKDSLEENAPTDTFSALTLPLILLPLKREFPKYKR